MFVDDDAAADVFAAEALGVEEWHCGWRGCGGDGCRCVCLDGGGDAVRGGVSFDRRESMGALEMGKGVDLLVEANWLWRERGDVIVGDVDQGRSWMLRLVVFVNSKWRP